MVPIFIKRNTKKIVLRNRNKKMLNHFTLVRNMFDLAMQSSSFYLFILCHYFFQGFYLGSAVNYANFSYISRTLFAV